MCELYAFAVILFSTLTSCYLIYCVLFENTLANNVHRIQQICLQLLLVLLCALVDLALE